MITTHAHTIIANPLPDVPMSPLLLLIATMITRVPTITAILASDATTQLSGVVVMIQMPARMIVVTLPLVASTFLFPVTTMTRQLKIVVTG
jgi:hypothetical protein